jgi:predicted unusual protein kinase regulating ubiquinone biosynthesis (AarF/ABC1/UbiB family)
MRQVLTGGKAGEPKLPPPAVLRKILVELGPVYVKLGQLLSTRPDLLPPSYIESLSTLQANVPAVAWREIEGVLRQQLKRTLEETFAAIEPDPQSAGSIAQIHRATLTSGEVVAVKIQRPGIEVLVERDIASIELAASLLAQTEFGQAYDIVGLAAEFARSLRAELDFTQEADFTNALRRNLAHSAWFDAQKLVLPTVYWELVTEKVLVLEWLEGEPLLAADIGGQSREAEATGARDKEKEEAQAEREAIATLLLRAFFQQVCIDGLFHADPHPGNLFYLRDGRVALLDCGMVGRLDPRTQQIAIELVLAIASLDPQRCAQLVIQLAPPEHPIHLIRLQNDFDRLLRRYTGIGLSQIQFGELFYDVLGTARNHRIRVPGNLGLCAKAITNLEGVGRSLDPDFDFVAQIRPLMTDLYRRQLVGNAPLSAMLRTVLDLKSLSLQSPRHIELLLERVTSETLQWQISLRDLDRLRRSIDDSANRLSFSIVVGALIIGAATISTPDASSKLFWVSNALFATASILGLWLAFSILRSGKL